MGNFEIRATFATTPAKLWQLHQDPRVLLDITPRFLGIRLLEPEARLAPSARFTLQIRPLGKWLPIHWETIVDRYDPPSCFVDIQGRGPFRAWRHTHRVEPHEHGAELIDTVEYVCPFGIVGALVDRLFLEHVLRRLFAHRAKAFERLLNR